MVYQGRCKALQQRGRLTQGLATHQAGQVGWLEMAEVEALHYYHSGVGSDLVRKLAIANINANDLQGALKA